MSLPHVLLGMLAEPSSGYELKQKFEQSVRYFWYAELSQIYPALAKLEKSGMLTSEKAPSEKGPNKRVYTRTTRGKNELRSWLADGPVLRTERIAYLTQLFFLEEIPLDERVRFFENLRDDFENVRLTFGDSLLVEGPAAGIHRLMEERDFVSLTEPRQRARHRTGP